MTGLGESAAPPAPVDAPAAPSPAPEPTEAWWYTGTDQPADGEGAKGVAEAAGAKEPASSEPAPGAPARYELAMEGVNLDPAMLTAAEPVLRELGLSNEHANKLVPVAAKLVSKTQESTMQAMIDAGAKQKKAWLTAYNSDPEIGGAGRAVTQQLAEKGMTALGFKAGHPFRQILTDSGFGNHPDMIRTFRRLGQLTGAGPAARAGNAPDTDGRWYGKGGG